MGFAQRRGDLERRSLSKETPNTRIQRLIRIPSCLKIAKTSCALAHVEKTFPYLLASFAEKDKKERDSRIIDREDER